MTRQLVEIVTPFVEAPVRRDFGLTVETNVCKINCTITMDYFHLNKHKKNKIHIRLNFKSLEQDFVFFLSHSLSALNN